MQTIAFPLALTAALFSSGAVAEPAFTVRDGGPTEQAMLARGDAGLAGLAFVRPVLSGVLYRAGFKGGDKRHTGLSDAQRQTLCEAGFSSARYVDFGSHTSFGHTGCGSSALDYRKASSGDTAPLMRDIHTVIQNPDMGPMLVHCMWGVHASGAVAAMALVQFCGWSEDDAKAYWNKARNGAPCAGGCDRWIDAKFDRFALDPDLRISAEQRAAICP